jgi:hypothetical protein
MANVMVHPLADSQGELARPPSRQLYTTEMSLRVQLRMLAACERMWHGIGADPATGNAVIAQERR